MSNVLDVVGTTDAIASQKPTKKSELESAQLELANMEKERMRLEILEKKANLQDIEERLAERELKRETKRQRSITNGETLKQLALGDLAAQRRCTHKKGGNGAEGVIGGQGQDAQYAVLKHIFANGDMWVRCLRCRKTWKPPIRSNFVTEELYLKAIAEYETAVNFPTRNVTSASIQFRFDDNGEYYRKVTDATNLR